LKYLTPTSHNSWSFFNFNVQHDGIVGSIIHFVTFHLLSSQFLLLWLLNNNPNLFHVLEFSFLASNNGFIHEKCEPLFLSQLGFFLHSIVSKFKPRYVCLFGWLVKILLRLLLVFSFCVCCKFCVFNHKGFWIYPFFEFSFFFELCFRNSIISSWSLKVDCWNPCS
jgi:hypothetical protein